TADVSLVNGSTSNLGIVQAQNLDINSSGAITDSGSIQVSGQTTLASEANITLDNAANNFNVLAVNQAANVTLADDDALTLVGVNASGLVDVTAEGLFVIGDISGGRINLNALNQAANINANLEATSGSAEIAGSGIVSNGSIRANGITLDGTTGAVQLNGELSSGGPETIAVRGSRIAQNANINSNASVSLTSDSTINQNATITAGDQITLLANNGFIQMANGTASSANQINYTANGGDIILGLLNAQSAISLATTGAVIDGNVNSRNLSASRVDISAVNGIGAGDSIEMAASTINVSNSRGSVDLENTGDVTIERLHNTGGIVFESIGDISINPLTGGVDAGFNDDSILRIESVGGSILDADSANTNDIDITASIATFVATNDFGALREPFSINVRDRVIIVATRNWTPRELFISPSSSNIQINAIDLSLTDLFGIGGGELVEVESLSEVNPAVFTNVKNYLFDNISIRLPSDQRYDEDEISYSQ
ncbi:MAG: hypothetical protein AAFZ92_09350, partial [Pseudomonadota bacterium]